MNQQTDFAEAPRTVFIGEGSHPRSLTREARVYALKELARRAGVSREDFLSWEIEVTDCQTVVHPGASKSHCVSFQHLPDDLIPHITPGTGPVGKAAWLQTPPNGPGEEELIIPFSAGRTPPGTPLFLPDQQGSFVCREDVLLSLLFTLSRVEEPACPMRDEHGRFPGSASVATRHGFLERPIVDEYGLVFSQVLSALLPSWQPKKTALRVKLTHDIDGIGIPVSLRTSLGHTWKRRSPASTLRDLAAVATGTEPAELALVRQLARISRDRGHHSAFYWKGSARTEMDEGYDPRHPKVQRVVRDLLEQGFEVGVHPGYFTFDSRSELFAEVQRLQQALGVEHPGGRQHYLRWSPATWLDWEACGLLYDSTVGYADRFGFRAGTAIPYHPWNFEENRELRLIEVPLVLMDCTPVKYMGLRREEALPRIAACIRRTAAVGGVFTLLWHNFPLLEPAYRGWYQAILDLLKDAENFRVPASPEELW